MGSGNAVVKPGRDACLSLLLGSLEHSLCSVGGTAGGLQRKAEGLRLTARAGAHGDDTRARDTERPQFRMHAVGESRTVG